MSQSRRHRASHIHRLFLSLASSCAALLLAAEAWTAPAPRGPAAFAGGEIAFVDGSLKVMNADGTGVQTIWSAGKQDVLRGPCWSPDGTQLALYAKIGNSRGIWTVDSSGANRRLIVPFPSYATLVAYPDWSRAPGPDGKYRIAFSLEVPYSPIPSIRKTDVFVVEPDGTGLTNLTNTGIPHEFYASWSADGSKIHCSRDLSQLVAIDVGVIGGVPVSLGETLVFYDAGEIHWPRAGSSTALCYSSDRGGRKRVMILDLETAGSPTLLTSTGSGDERWAAFGPGATRLVFCRSGTGQSGGIFTIGADGTNQIRIAAKGSDTSWRP